MFKYAFLLFFWLIFFSIFSQNLKIEEPCVNWYITPILFNNVISDSTEVTHWENYWYYRSDNDSKLIPDSLQIRLLLSPSIAILPKADFIDASYNIKTMIKLKYGNYDDSYNVVNPRTSDNIEVLNKQISLKEIYNSFILTDSMGYWIDVKNLPLKEILDNLNIWIEDEPWDYNSRGKPYALNQIIITTYFIDIYDITKCWSEFTFPINGAYGNPLGGKWEY